MTVCIYSEVTMNHLLHCSWSLCWPVNSFGLFETNTTWTVSSKSNPQLDLFLSHHEEPILISNIVIFIPLKIKGFLFMCALSRHIYWIRNQNRILWNTGTHPISCYSNNIITWHAFWKTWLYSQREWKKSVNLWMSWMKFWPHRLPERSLGSPWGSLNQL